MTTLKKYLPLNFGGAVFYSVHQPVVFRRAFGSAGTAGGGRRGSSAALAGTHDAT